MQPWRVYAEQKNREQQLADAEKRQGKTGSGSGCGFLALILIGLCLIIGRLP